MAAHARTTASGLAAVAALVATLAAGAALAQDAPAAEEPSLFRDAADGAFDISGWAATNTGFIPVVSPITEPAVGWGGSVAAVLVHGGGLAKLKDAPLGATGRPVPPDVSAAGAALTENGTWGVAAGHVGFWGGDRWRYSGGGGFMSPELDVYDAAGRAYGFNLEGWVLLQELRRRVGRSELFLGARYLLMDTTTRFDLGLLPVDIPEREIDTTDSGLGLVAEYDTRNNIFTPTSGVQLKLVATAFGSYVGGDHDYETYRGDLRGYWELHPRLVVASRLLAENASSDAPFYMRPFVTLRGVPVMRYQGESEVSLEAEARWAVHPRWWLVGFAGAGWTAAGDARSLDDTTVHAGGIGCRYLIARLLGLHMGLDVATSGDDAAFYVVFGGPWF